MAIRNDASLRGKIRAIAKREGLRPQEVLQMFLFEHLLLRLEKTSYVDRRCQWVVAMSSLNASVGVR